MDKLNFPDIKISRKTRKLLSMDEYLEFVIFNLENFHDPKASAWWKKQKRVKARFVLK